MSDTVQTIKARLAQRGDARYDWWVHMEELIENRKYDRVLDKLRQNINDDDFTEQVEAVARTIAK